MGAPGLLAVLVALGLALPARATSFDDPRIVRSGSVVSSANSSTVPLGAGAEFVGAAENALSFSDISVFIHSDVVSSTDGLKIQWSTDGVNFDDDDAFTFNPGKTKIFTFGVPTSFFRVRYKNGGSAQGAFRLQTILHAHRIKPSSHRLTGTVGDQNDAELNLCVISGKDPLNGGFKNVGVSGIRMLVSQAVGQAPAGSTAVTRISSAAVMGTSDDVYTIANGVELTLLRLNIGCEKNCEVELLVDETGDGSQIRVIENLFADVSSAQGDIFDEVTGNGARAIRTRRKTFGAGAPKIFFRWDGFTTP